MRVNDLPPYFKGKVKLMNPLTKEVNTRCWVWQRSLSHGYAQGFWNGKVVRLHHVTLGLAGRPRPAGMDADHLCCRRNCVNPHHIEYVTKGVNGSRVKTRGRHWQSQKTHCKHGHEFTPENTIDRDGRRQCRQCHNEEAKLAKPAYRVEIVVTAAQS